MEQGTERVNEEGMMREGGWKDRRKQRSTHNHTRNMKDQSTQMPIPIPELPGCFIQN